MPIATLSAAVRNDRSAIRHLQAALTQARTDLNAAQQAHSDALGAFSHRVEVGPFGRIARQLRRRQAAVRLLETELADRIAALEFAEAITH